MEKELTFMRFIKRDEELFVNADDVAKYLHDGGNSEGFCVYADQGDSALNSQRAGERSVAHVRSDMVATFLDDPEEKYAPADKKDVLGINRLLLLLAIVQFVLAVAVLIHVWKTL